MASKNVECHVAFIYTVVNVETNILYLNPKLFFRGPNLMKLKKQWPPPILPYTLFFALHQQF